ncbi:hypothetical protein M8C13_05350 [Crossiella sp. SN42]|uniref:hypothetical protein n=1 Tax=Crossiella sp. SN42 TaxID=2944808 RepID=UPI00207CCD39|nr:hypothetical protein [Crossiella sp. SN42]MCO1575185.1 hypothetical protein [Crossiella sp. SN42]
MMPPRAVAVLAVVLAFATASPAWAGADRDSPITVVPGDLFGHIGAPTVDLGATAPGQPGRPGRGASAPGGRGGPAPVCTYTRAAHSPSEMFGKYREWHAGSLGGDGKVAYTRTCNGMTSGWVTGPTPAPGAAPVPILPNPAELAARAYEQLVLPLPVPRLSPDVHLGDGRRATVVGEHTWLWTEPRVWRPQVERVQAGPVWAEVTATPTALSFDSGMGQNRSCTGPGTPYTRAAGLHAASPDCDFVYPRSTHGQPGGQVRTRFAITWSVSWTGSTGTAPAGGRLPEMVSRAELPLAVVEAQALRQARPVPALLRKEKG